MSNRKELGGRLSSLAIALNLGVVVVRHPLPLSYLCQVRRIRGGDTMNETDRLLMDIATRMLDRREVEPVLAQLKEIQKSVNTCAWILVIIGVTTGGAAIRFLF